MDVTPLIPQGRKIITGYGNGGFKINYVEVNGSYIILAEEVFDWAVHEIAAITLSNLQPVLRSEPAIDLLLIGSGKSTLPLAMDIREALKARGIAVECMDTGAACRTYNVLLAEERRVAAALIAI